MKNILVTGGTGFIGSHICLLLLEKGYELFVLDSCINSSSNSLKRIDKILENQKLDVNSKLHFIKGDLRNKSDVEKYLIMP